MTFAQFFQENIFMFILLAIVIAAIIVYELRNRTITGKTVSPSQAAQIANRGGTMIDLRSSADYKKGHIAGAKNIPAEQFAQKIASSKIKPNQAIILIDQNGLGAKNQAKWLHENGYSEIYILSGGLLTWQEENLPLVK